MIKVTFRYIFIIKLYTGFSLKKIMKISFSDKCFFSYSQGFGKELFNPQELICEKFHLVRVHLQEKNLIILNNSVNSSQLSLFSKFLENVI